MLSCCWIRSRVTNSVVVNEPNLHQTAPVRTEPPVGQWLAGVGLASTFILYVSSGWNPTFLWIKILAVLIGLVFVIGFAAKHTINVKPLNAVIRVLFLILFWSAILTYSFGVISAGWIFVRGTLSILAGGEHYSDELPENWRP